MKRFLLILLTTSYAALGQSSDTTANLVDFSAKNKFSYSLMTEVGISVASTRMLAIRSFFRENQIKPDSHLDPLINAGFGIRYGRLKAMLQAGYGLNLVRPTNSPLTTVARQIDARYGGLLVGFDVANFRTKRLYVNVGLGSIGYEYSVYQQTNQVVLFGDLRQANQAGTISSLRLNHPYLDINLEYAQRETQKAGAEAVLRVGYRQGVRKQAWTSDAFQLLAGPTDRISQFYLQAAYSFSSNYARRRK